MKKVLLSSVLALSAIASVSYAATKVPSIPGVTAPTTGTVTKANAANNHNNRFGYAVSPLRGEKAINFAGAETYPAKPVAGTDGKPLDDATRKFGDNTRFGAGFNAAKSATPATPATPAKPATPATPAKPATPATPDPKAIPGVTRPTTEIVTEANAANNHNNRFGYAVSPLRGEKAINFAGAETYPAKPVAGTDGKPLDDATREFGNNTRFGAGFNK
ncbi:hypothetical protein [Streptococcus parasanguinis]|uniref:hypothetical protein n=1 Tax=Streptococcus parasanguinis TaxID=1318 RepID=UPI0015FDA8E6|nr:hypothetical protein [Streptococcus parasanguinis]